MKRFFLTKTFRQGLERSDCSRSAKLVDGRVNCSVQIISLQRFDKVSDEIKPHR